MISFALASSQILVLNLVRLFLFLVILYTEWSG